MALPNLPLFNFYRRYVWNEQDFEDWQNGMIGLGRGVFEGLFNGAVMSGYQAAVSGSMDIGVSGGIAVGPSGYMMVQDVSNVVTIPAPSTDPRRDLVVVRPLEVPDTPITRPTSPFDTVYLKTLQECEIVLLQGTEDVQPEYPAKEANDVVLFGVRSYVGQTSVVEADIDFEAREIYGKNSIFQNNFGRYDDRCRPYRADFETVGVKPSQLKNPSARGFTYVTQDPSAFPRDVSSNYVHEDTFLNFLTGVISGADELSSDFTPTIPTAGNAIVASISLKSDDTLAVAFGTVGTRVQCVDGIMNQKLSGAGSVALTASSKLLCFVILYSSNGTDIDEVDVIDTRSLGIAVASKVIPNVTQKVFADSPFTALTTNDIIEYDCTGGDSTVSPYAAAANTGRQLIVRKTDATANELTITGVTTLYYQDEVVAIYSDGSSWKVLWSYRPVQDVELYLDSGAGHGSTNTKIRRFLNVRKNTLGSDATYTDSATAGMDITFNRPGLYHFKYTDARAAADTFHGISLNSSSLGTGISTLTYAQGKRAVTATFPSGPRHYSTSVVLRVVAGDIVRAHDEGANDGASSQTTFQCIRIGD